MQIKIKTGYRNNSKNFIRLCIAIAILFFVYIIRAQATRQELKFSHISVEDPLVITVKYQPLLDILAEKTGLEIVFAHKASYSEINDAFINNEIDIGILNSYSYIQIAEKAGIKPLARRVIRKNGTYHSYIIVRKDAHITNWGDLKGKGFAFSDINSTTGFLFPKMMLQKNGIDLHRDLAKTVFIVNQSSLIYAVLNRTADAGAVASYIFDDFFAELDAGVKQKVEILCESVLIPLGPFVIKTNIEGKLQDQIQSILLALNTHSEGLSALETAGLTGFEEAEDKDYDVIRKMAAVSDKEE